MSATPTPASTPDGPLRAVTTPDVRPQRFHAPRKARLAITSTFEIAATHRLPYHQGKCRRTHGHNYRIIFKRFGDPLDLHNFWPIGEPPPSDAGMLMDFGDFDAEIKRVLDTLDHWPLNDDLREQEAARLCLDVIDVLDLPNPTAEHLALWLLDRLPIVDEVEVWETGRHSATATRAESRLTRLEAFWEDFTHLPPHRQEQMAKDLLNALFRQGAVFLQGHPQGHPQGEGHANGD